MKLALLFGSTSLVVIIAMSSALAAPDTTGMSLTTSPVALTLNAKPGTSSTSTLQVMNNGTQPVRIKTQVALFKAYGENGQAAIINTPPTGDTSVDWVHINPSSFVAQPSVWTQVKMELDIPKIASLGYYYAILFKPDLPSAPSQPATSIQGSNAILVLVDTHSGDEIRALSITRFSTDKGFYEYLPTTFNVTVHNAGNIYTAPRGNIFISRRSDMRDTEASLPLNASGGNVLPDSSRDYQVAWSAGFPAYQTKLVAGVPLTDNGKPVKQLIWDFTKLPNFRIGRYYAKLTLVYNDGVRDIPLTQEISFWVIPWKLLLIALAIVTLLTIGLWSTIRTIFGRLRSLLSYRIRHYRGRGTSV